MAVGVREGLKHDSGIHCDELVSMPKTLLTRFVGHLAEDGLVKLDAALKVALAIED